MLGQLGYPIVSVRVIDVSPNVAVMAADPELRPVTGNSPWVSPAATVTVSPNTLAAASSELCTDTVTALFWFGSFARACPATGTASFLTAWDELGVAISRLEIARRGAHAVDRGESRDFVFGTAVVLAFIDLEFVGGYIAMGTALVACGALLALATSSQFFNRPKAPDSAVRARAAPIGGRTLTAVARLNAKLQCL